MQSAVMSRFDWRPVELMIGLLLVLNLLDYATTYVALEDMAAEEANPVLDYLIHLTGTIWVILAFKLTAFTYLILSYTLIEKFRVGCQKTPILWAFSILCVVYTSLVINNFYLIIVRPANYWLS